MNTVRCDMVQDRLPDMVGDRLSQDEAALLGAHVQDCSECREVLDLLRLLEGTRPMAPAGLADEIHASLRRPRRPVTRPWWGLAAAAVAALALGIGVSSHGASPVEVPAYVAEAEGTSPWMSDDGTIAGAPNLGDLSDEALMTLLDEMGASPSGGAA